ncbi:MAG: NAD(P)-dependent oxidoreductase [Bacteriovoracaceae bacterium]|jgi:D-3-phosphoglycerate dehydrogenase|nr:NAD(P)-dependent oxidoreductase [Bacteriovoracaceae bacterium]
MELQVYRTSASSYQNSVFLNKEQKVLEGIQGVKYINTLQEIDKNIPFVLLTNTHTIPNELSTSILEKTQLIIHPNSGHDNFSQDFVKRADFPIILGNPIRANAVCEYTLSCLFQHFTKIPNHQHWPQERTWNRKLIRDQKVLIIGCGHIGKTLYKSLSPIAQQVMVYDPYVQNEVFPNLIKTWDTEKFKDISVLIIAANLNPSTYHLVDQEFFGHLSADCLIINPARGEIISENDLVHFLQKNPKAFCFLDVFEKEPFSPGHLNDLPNLNKTAHIAGVFHRLNHDIISFEYLIIKEFMDYKKRDALKDFQKDYNDCILNEENYNKYEK